MPSLRPSLLELVGENFVICRLPASSAIPTWALKHATAALAAIARTDDELSIVCPTGHVPDDPQLRQSHDWRCLRVAGQLDFALTGVLSSILTPLADAEIGVFTIATFDTDYILVKEENLARAIAALRAAGHRVKA